jgi:hypothetical protein
MDTGCCWIGSSDGGRAEGFHRGERLRGLSGRHRWVSKRGSRGSLIYGPRRYAGICTGLNWRVGRIPRERSRWKIGSARRRIGWARAADWPAARARPTRAGSAVSPAGPGPSAR